MAKQGRIKHQTRMIGDMGTYSWSDPLCQFGMTPFVEVGSALVDSVTHFIEVMTHFDSAIHFVDMEEK